MQSLYLEKTNTSFFFWNAIKVRVESDKHFRTEIKVRRKWKEPYLLKKKKKTEFKNIILLKQDQMWKRFHFDQGSLAMLKKKKKKPLPLSTTIKAPAPTSNFYSMSHDSSNVNMHKNCYWYMFLFRKSEVGPESLHFNKFSGDASAAGSWPHWSNVTKVQAEGEFPNTI